MNSAALLAMWACRLTNRTLAADALSDAPGPLVDAGLLRRHCPRRPARSPSPRPLDLGPCPRRPRHGLRPHPLDGELGGAGVKVDRKVAPWCTEMSSAGKDDAPRRHHGPPESDRVRDPCAERAHPRGSFRPRLCENVSAARDGRVFVPRRPSQHSLASPTHHGNDAFRPSVLFAYMDRDAPHQDFICDLLSHSRPHASFGCGEASTWSRG